MRFAIQTPVQNTSFERLLSLWQTADRTGFSAAFTFDHFVPLGPGARPGNIGAVPDGKQLEGWITLSALASQTERIEVGTLVSGVTHRPPAVLAKMVLTLDEITGGRAILGVGAGWHETEHRMMGIAFPAVRDRMNLLAETVDAFQLLCAAAGSVTYQGCQVTLDGAPFEPKPVDGQRGVPVLIGGSGHRLRDIVARSADIYNGFWSPIEWPEINSDLDRRLRTFGRAPSELERSVFVNAELSGDPQRERALVSELMATRGGNASEVRARSLVGGPAEVAEVLNSYRDAGVDMIVLSLRPDTEPDDLEHFSQHMREFQEK